MRTIRLAEAAFQRNPQWEPDHVGYFELCVSAHHATVCSFVPTDVDNQIRSRLWLPQLSTEELEQMAELVLASREWEFGAVSNRLIATPVSARPLSGHDGEWFSTAIPAYWSLRDRSPQLSQAVAAKILEEIERQAAILRHFAEAQEQIELLRASLLVAHNTGDLDRVIDMWNIPDEDPLKQILYKAGHERPERWGGWLFAAGHLNKAFMADENPRHFALRNPRCLRRDPSLFTPICPFLDDWGQRIASHPLLAKEEIAKVAEALIDGWHWMSDKKGGGPEVPVGYARGLAGILDRFPGGLNGLVDYLPARNAKQLKTGVLRTQCAVPRARFEEQWRRKAIHAMESLPIKPLH